MSEPVLTPGKASLLMLGIGTLALMGVPGVGYEPVPAGPITGRILDPEGAPVADAEVALFADDAPGLVEIAHTDARGLFAFGVAPDRFHVFASRPGDPAWIGAWSPDRRGRPRTVVNLTLEHGDPTRVTVVDPDGTPASAAEVRVFDARRGHLAVSRTLTDELGQCTVTLPARAHVAVLARDARTPSWWLEGHPALTDADLELRLPRTHRVQARAVDAQGQGQAELLVSAHGPAPEEPWYGWARTTEDGSFEMNVPDVRVTWRVTDAAGRRARGRGGDPIRVQTGEPDR